MRIAFLFAVAVAAAAAQTDFPDYSETPYPGDWRCLDGYGYYNGWCFKSSNTDLSYYDAVEFCRYEYGKAPSIHSKDNLDFWIGALPYMGYQFWLDASCPWVGQPYQWGDNTPTDYYGPRGELRSCSNGYGYLIGYDGLEFWSYPSRKRAICVYNYDGSTFAPPEETTPSQEETTPNPTDMYCARNPSTVYLDIVFIVDTSSDMTTHTVNDATASIKSMLYGLTLGTNFWQSNVGALAFGDKVQTVKNFGGLRSTNDINTLTFPYLGGKASKMTDAIELAASMISSNARSYTRGVIVLLSKSYNQLDSTNIKEAAEEFKSDGGIFISIDYLSGMGIKGLQEIASPGYYVNDAGKADNLPADILYAFCDANCFCPDGLYPYNVANEIGRELPLGCYHIAETSSIELAAEDACRSQNGFISTVHDNDKNFFLLSIFPGKVRYWLGMKKYGNYYQWADGSNDGTTFWAPGNPVNGQDCVYAQQTTGFNAPWYSAPCTDPLKYSLTYACQLRPCDSEYDCRS